MTDIVTLLKQHYNPFDLTTARSGNFWSETQEENLTVESIHKDQLSEIIQIIARVQKDRRSRTVLLKGDLASGKSYFLGRLKKKVNPKALFAYIGSWADNRYIWRHVLRQTVDSLMQTPENKKKSQFILWLESLSAFKDKSLTKKLLGEKAAFLQNFKSSYPVGIYQAQSFFSALYHVTQPSSYLTACDWLRGEDLDASDLKKLGIKHSLASEEDAKNILMNLGKVSAQAKYPIVLCFDQVDQACLKSQGLENLLGVNTTIHNEKLKNFTVILSFIADTWETHKSKQIQADRDRLDLLIDLKPISIDQAEEIWQKRLSPFYQKATPKPETPIYPLSRQQLEQNFPRGRTVPRAVIQCGHQLIQKIKGQEQIDESNSFQLVWEKEFKKTQAKVTRIRQYDSTELAQYLTQVLEMLQIDDVHYKYLGSPTYESYSLSFTHPDTKKKIGIFWNENPNMRSFCYAMQACEKQVQHSDGDELILLRSESVGTKNNKGYKLFKEIFDGNPHRHSVPHVNSVQYLVTYHSLVNAAVSGELVVGYRSPNLETLQNMVRESGVFKSCTLLHDLDLLGTTPKPISEPPPLEPVKHFLVTRLIQENYLGLAILFESAQKEFDRIPEQQLQQVIQDLEQEGCLQIIGKNTGIQGQSVMWIPESQRKNKKK